MTRFHRTFALASATVACALVWGAASASGADAHSEPASSAQTSEAWASSAQTSAVWASPAGAEVSDRHLIAMVAVRGVEEAAHEVHAPIGQFDAPVDPFILEAPARIPDVPWKPGHRGIDMASHVDDPVYAPADGVVTFVGTVVDRAVVSIRHTNGLISSVEPVLGSVAAGDQVARGMEIGRVTPEGGHCEPATCVHWGIRRGDAYIDPLDVLAGYGPVRLLEVG